MKIIILSIAILVTSKIAYAKPQVATTTTDIAAIVREVAKNQVEVFSIGKGTQDPHQIEAKPSYMVKLRNMDLIIAHGLELESAWLEPLIQGARNPKLKSKSGVFELVAELDPIEVQSKNISRAEGDIHAGGNPHFQLDPIRVGNAAVLIANKLSELDPAQKDFFHANAAYFQKQFIEKNKEWQRRLHKTGIRELVTYHKTFAYFCSRFGIECELQLEPKPGIPPTAKHLLTVIEEMKKRKIKIVLIENLYDDSVESKLKTYLPSLYVTRLPVSVEGEPGLITNEHLIERIVKAIEQGAN